MQAVPNTNFDIEAVENLAAELAKTFNSTNERELAQARNKLAAAKVDIAGCDDAIDKFQTSIVRANEIIASRTKQREALKVRARAYARSIAEYEVE